MKIAKQSQWRNKQNGKTVTVFSVGSRYVGCAGDGNYPNSTAGTKYARALFLQWFEPITTGEQHG